MADFANTGGEVEERDGMVMDWSDLMAEDRLGVAEVIAKQQPREEPPDDDESRAAAVLDAIFNDTSSELDFEGFALAEVEASMMPTIEARVDSSEDDMGKNHEGKGGPAPESLIRTLTKLLLMAWMQTVALKVRSTGETE